MIRWIRRTCALLFAVLITVGGASIPASAGGPTSVLLSAPPRVVAFGYEDALYDQLLKLVGEPPPATGPSTESHQSGQFVRATWLIHDMTVWRLDIIYPDAPSGPWIATFESIDGTAKLPENPVWHQAEGDAGRALKEMLGSLKLLGQSQFDGGPTGLDEVLQPTPTPQPASASQTIETHDGALSGWRWIIPGIALGAVATYFALRYLPRRRPWELTDVE